MGISSSDRHGGVCSASAWTSIGMFTLTGNFEWAEYTYYYSLLVLSSLLLVQYSKKYMFTSHATQFPWPIIILLGQKLGQVTLNNASVSVWDTFKNSTTIFFLIQQRKYFQLPWVQNIYVDGHQLHHHLFKLNIWQESLHVQCDACAGYSERNRVHARAFPGGQQPIYSCDSEHDPSNFSEVCLSANKILTFRC